MDRGAIERASYWVGGGAMKLASYMVDGGAIEVGTWVLGFIWLRVKTAILLWATDPGIFGGWSLFSDIFVEFRRI